MGVYIMGMEMPTSCQKCPFLDYEEGFCFASGAKGKSGWYEFTLRPGEIKDRRHDDCPLVPVPPHGRLIDVRDILKNQHDVILKNGAKHRCFDTTQLSEIPTIIPASEESET